LEKQPQDRMMSIFQHEFLLDACYVEPLSCKVFKAHYVIRWVC